MNDDIFSEEMGFENSQCDESAENSTKKPARKSKNSEENLAQNLSFEELLARLEEIIEQINSQDVSLEQSLKLFKEGEIIAKKAHEILENAKLSISEFKGE